MHLKLIFYGRECTIVFNYAIDFVKIMSKIVLAKLIGHPKAK